MKATRNTGYCQALLDTVLSWTVKLLNGRQPKPSAVLSASVMEAETGLALRQLERATSAVARIRCDLRQVELLSRAEARVALARTLTEGSDGGCMGQIYRMSKRPGGEVAQIILEKFRDTLGLSHYREEGDTVDVSNAEPGAFEFFKGDFVSGLAIVDRPGWRLSDQDLRPPLVRSMNNDFFPE